MGDGTPSRHNGQEERYRQRRKPLGDQDHGQRQIPSKTLPARHHSLPRNHENRQRPAKAGDRLTSSPPFTDVVSRLAFSSPSSAINGRIAAKKTYINKQLNLFVHDELITLFIFST